MIQYNIVLIQVFQKGCPSITTFLVQAVLKLQTRWTVKSSPRCLNNIGGSGQSFGLIAHSSCVQKSSMNKSSFIPMLISSLRAPAVLSFSCGPLTSPLAGCARTARWRRACRVWLFTRVLHAIPKSLNLTQLSGGGKRSRWSPTIATHLIFTKQF